MIRVAPVCWDCRWVYQDKVTRDNLVGVYAPSLYIRQGTSRRRCRVCAQMTTWRWHQV